MILLYMHISTPNQKTFVNLHCIQYIHIMQTHPFSIIPAALSTVHSCSAPKKKEKSRPVEAYELVYLNIHFMLSTCYLSPKLTSLFNCSSTRLFQYQDMVDITLKNNSNSVCFLTGGSERGFSLFSKLIQSEKKKNSVGFFVACRLVVCQSRRKRCFEF